MAFVRQNVNLDRGQLKLAQRLARESGSGFSAYVREALERHNTSMSVASVLENSNAHLEQPLPSSCPRWWKPPWSRLLQQCLQSRPSQNLRSRSQSRSPLPM